MTKILLTIASISIFASCTDALEFQEEDEIDIQVEFISLSAENVEDRTALLNTKMLFRIPDEYDLWNIVGPILTTDSTLFNNNVEFISATERDSTFSFNKESGILDISTPIMGLESDTEYFYRYKATREDKEYFSYAYTFRTEPVQEEKVQVEFISLSAENVEDRTARLNTKILFNVPDERRLWKVEGPILTTDSTLFSSNVEFFDATERDGKFFYNSETGILDISTPIMGLDSDTEYFYRYRATRGDQEYLSYAYTFRTEPIDLSNGGYVIYERTEPVDGWQYLVAAPNDWYKNDDGFEHDFIWGCNGSEAGAFGSAIGTGMENTQRIVESDCSVDSTNIISAAKYISELELNGFDDWFLPSLGEMKKLIQHVGHTGLDFNYHLTSTEQDTILATSIDRWGYGDHVYKDRKVAVHPMRRF